MQVKIELNPDECLALIQVLERDILFRDLSERVITDLERARHEWANEVRNMAYLREKHGKAQVFCVECGRAVMDDRDEKCELCTYQEVTRHVKAAGFEVVASANRREGFEPVVAGRTKYYRGHDHTGISITPLTKKQEQ
jgi:hypothetical protein